jgi:hypothetical protein
MDYGHGLLFRTFITPAVQRPHHAVELAAVADRVGLDLVTFQNLPLRPPVTLARAAASAGLLSGGRSELAFGAGRVWNAIEAMGRPRRTPGEAVEALSSPDFCLGPAKGGGT